MVNLDFDFGGITAFHCGIFAAFYFCAAYAIWVYYRHIRGDIALSLQSAASGLCHVLIFLSGTITPPSRHLYLAIACYCCCASPTIMLCLREAINPGWLTWKRYFQYVGFFLVGTVLAAIFAQEYIFFIMIFADFWFCCYAAHRLIRGINRHEKILKQYYTETESYSYNWVRGFVYFQVATVVIFFLLYIFLSVPFNIIFNYAQAFYWLYFILMCKKYRYYSCQIPEDLMEEIVRQENEAEVKDVAKIVYGILNPEPIAVEESDKYQLSERNKEFISKQLDRFVRDKGYLDSSITTSNLAAEMGTNRTYLCAFFKEKNTTFSDYVNGLRCEDAIRILTTQPDITITALAERVGFRSENCFRKFFISVHGVSPSIYRRKQLMQKI